MVELKLINGNVKEFESVEEMETYFDDNETKIWNMVDEIEIAEVYDTVKIDVYKKKNKKKYIMVYGQEDHYQNDNADPDTYGKCKTFSQIAEWAYDHNYILKYTL